MGQDDKRGTPWWTGADALSFVEQDVQASTRAAGTTEDMAGVESPWWLKVRHDVQMSGEGIESARFEFGHRLSLMGLVGTRAISSFFSRIRV